jgi:ferredoxin
MNITKVWIEDGCTSCGLCEDICPSVFKIHDTAEVIEGANYTGHEREIEDAADSCPVGVIKFST